MSDANRNPYAPPQTGVGDVASGMPIARPPQVGYAVALMWLALVLDILDTVVDPQFAEAELVSQAIIAVLLAMQAVFIVLVSAGHNWARILVLVMFLLGTLMTVSDFGEEWRHSRLVAWIDVSSMGVEALALVLIFTRPGSRWFRRAVSSPKTAGRRADGAAG